MSIQLIQIHSEKKLLLRLIKSHKVEEKYLNSMLHQAS